MPRYSVTFPIVGTATISVEADNRDDAIEAAFSSDVDKDNIDEWEILRKACRGNVCSLPTHGVDVWEEPE